MSEYRSLESYKDEEGVYVDQDGVSWKSAEDLLQGYFLGFCCCGIPEQSIELAANALKLLNEEREPYHEFSLKASRLFHGNEAVEWFVWYGLSKADLTEHGGCVPGWVSEKGKQFLHLYDQYLEVKELEENL